MAWKQLDLSKPSRVIQLGKQHIHAMTVHDGGGGPIVVIATEDYCIHVVKYTVHKKDKNTVTETKDTNGWSICYMFSTPEIEVCNEKKGVAISWLVCVKKF